MSAQKTCTRHMARHSASETGPIIPFPCHAVALLVLMNPGPNLLQFCGEALYERWADSFWLSHANKKLLDTESAPSYAHGISRLKRAAGGADERCPHTRPPAPNCICASSPPDSSNHQRAHNRRCIHGTKSRVVSGSPPNRTLLTRKTASS